MKKFYENYLEWVIATDNVAKDIQDAKDYYENTMDFYREQLEDDDLDADTIADIKEELSTDATSDSDYIDYAEQSIEDMGEAYEIVSSYELHSKQVSELENEANKVKSVIDLIESKGFTPIKISYSSKTTSTYLQFDKSDFKAIQTAFADNDTFTFDDSDVSPLFEIRIANHQVGGCHDVMTGNDISYGDSDVNVNINKL